jgi:hypothetical protein
MRRLTADEFYKVAGVDRSTFKAAVHREEVALAHGTQWPLAGGTFLDLDVISWMLVDELTPAFSRKLAAVFVRGFSDVWTEALARAETQDEPVFLIVTEVGELISGGMRAIHAYVDVQCGTLSELGQSAYKPGGSIGPDRMTLVNMTSVQRRVRLAAAKVGVDLSASFCPHPDDPEFARIRRETKKWRELYVEKISAGAQR